MKPPLVSAVLTEVQAKKTKKEKIEHLRFHRGNPVMKEFFKYVWDDSIQFLLPEGDPPYKPNEDLDESGLYQELRKMYLFIEGQTNPGLKPVRREVLFIQLLEGIHADEAKLLLSVKDKKMPYKSITKKLVEEALPGLL